MDLRILFSLFTMLGVLSLVTLFVVFTLGFKKFLDTLYGDYKSRRNEESQEQMSAINNLFGQFQANMDKQYLLLEGQPTHNSCFYFNADGEAYNLNNDSWSIEIDRENGRELVNGGMTVFLKYRKVIIDKFKLDFTKFSQKSEDKKYVDYAISLMRVSKLDFKILHFNILNEFVDGIHKQPTIYHHVLANLIIYSLIATIRPLYEEEQKKLEEEKAKEAGKELRESGEGDKLSAIIKENKESEDKSRVDSYLPEKIVCPESSIIREGVEHKITTIRGNDTYECSCGCVFQSSPEF